MAPVWTLHCATHVQPFEVVKHLIVQIYPFLVSGCWLCFGALCYKLGSGPIVIAKFYQYQTVTRLSSAVTAHHPQITHTILCYVCDSLCLNISENRVPAFSLSIFLQLPILVCEMHHSVYVTVAV